MIISSEAGHRLQLGCCSEQTGTNEISVSQGGSGILRSVVSWNLTEVSEVFTASIIRGVSKTMSEDRFSPLLTSILQPLSIVRPNLDLMKLAPIF
jgi:hypothetical protein